MDKILVYRSCSYGSYPSYGISFSFLFFFLTTPIHIICVFGVQRVKANFQQLGRYFCTHIMKSFVLQVHGDFCMRKELSQVYGGLLHSIEVALHLSVNCTYDRKLNGYS